MGQWMYINVGGGGAQRERERKQGGVVTMGTY